MKLSELRERLTVPDTIVEEPPPFRGVVIPKNNLWREDMLGKEFIEFTYSARILPDGTLVAVGNYVYKVTHRSRRPFRDHVYHARRVPEYDPR